MSTEIMDNNLNLNGIKDYSTRYAKKVISSYFSTNSVIDGEAIKSLVDIKQINLFVIKNLFEEWQKETDKIKSKYFDYNAEPVQKALAEFMNVLSRSIAIKKEDFEPLLIKSVEESVLLIFSPYDFYIHLGDHANGGLTLENLKRTMRYVKVNKNLFESLISLMESKQLTAVNDEEFKKLINEVFHNIQASPEDIGVYFDNFSKIEELKESDIYGVLIDDKPKSPLVEIEEETTSHGEGDLFDDEPIIDKVGSREEPKPTLNELHASEKPTVAETHQSKKIDNIASSLSINQRFMFQNALFDGSQEKMKDTLEELESMGSKSEAMKFIYSEFPHWNIESEEFEEFIELVEKRFN